MTHAHWEQLLVWAKNGAGVKSNVWWRQVQMSYRKDRETAGFVCIAKWRDTRNETDQMVLGFGLTSNAAAEDCWRHLDEIGIAEKEMGE